MAQFWVQTYLQPTPKGKGSRLRSRIVNKPERLKLSHATDAIGRRKTSLRIWLVTGVYDRTEALACLLHHLSGHAFQLGSTIVQIREGELPT